MQVHELNTSNETPAYAATVDLPFASDAAKTNVYYSPTGATTFTANVKRPLKSDRLVMDFKADGSARTMTFSTGFSGLSATTIVVGANKSATISFQFDGANWVETARTVGA